MQRIHVAAFAWLVAAMGCGSSEVGTANEATSSSELAARAFSGAIFTTYATGSVVNANIYDDCTEVYLNGGPAGGGPGLPEGDYYFMVTSPSSGPPSVQLSQDDLGLRKVHVGSSGKIDAYAPSPGSGLHGSQLQPDGSVRVQLWPFDETPNPGNEYKAWLTPVSAYTPGEGTHGFLPRWSKTDNFKCVWKLPVPPCDQYPSCTPTDAGAPADSGIDTGVGVDSGPPEIGIQIIPIWWT